MRIIILLISVLVCPLLTQCASYDFARRVAQQGNLLPQSKIERLKIGMSKNDAAILMGTSLMSPTFNNNRWDYAYTWRKGNRPLKIKTIRLFFVNNSLAKIERKP